MVKWKKSLANSIGKAINASIIPRGEVALLFEKEHLQRFLTDFQIDCVFDVGANEGQYAEKLREIGFRGSIISFEPIPALASILRRKASRDRHWIIEEIALDEKVRHVAFNVMVDSQFSSLKRPSHLETDLFTKMNVVAQSINLTTARLAELFDKYRGQLGFSRPFLKMDTQGNDLAVARGACDRLQRFFGLQSELTIKKVYFEQPDYREAIDFYIAAGFELSAFVPNNLGHFPALIEIDCIMYNARLICLEDTGPRQTVSDSESVPFSSERGLERASRQSSAYPALNYIRSEN
jgi:FkbM family methyltransferase